MTASVTSQIATLIGEDLFMNFMPVISTAAAAVNANPQEILNPLNAGIFGVQLFANLQAAVPAAESVAVQDVAQLATALLTALSAKVSAASAGVTPASIAAGLVGTPVPAVTGA